MAKAKKAAPRKISAKAEDPRKISPEDVLAALGKAVPLDERLPELLSLPPGLLMQDRWSFSSAEEPVSPIFARMLERGIPGGTLPEYAVAVLSRGSNSFCALIDSKRKVIVIEPIDSAYSGQGSWHAFESSLSEALKKAKELGSSRSFFNFVLAVDSVQSVI